MVCSPSKIGTAVSLVRNADAYIASIAIRIMSDTRDEEKDRNKIKGVLQVQDAQDPRTNCRYINMIPVIIYLIV
jgi:hypothetical protein